MRVVRSVARNAPGCHEGCGVLLHVKDGRLLKVDGDPEAPHNQGRLCPRCIALPEVVYHPDRVTYPLKRVGPRGSGQWQRVSWDEAYGEITERFARIKSESGPESLAFFRGTGRDIGTYISRLAFSLGSPNVFDFAPMHGHACHAPKTYVQRAIFGNYAVADAAQLHSGRYDHPDWMPPKVLIVWGCNPVNSNPDGFMGHWVLDCMRRGTEVIVVDPRRTWLASRAKLWLQIRPGTDAALALGMLNVIISEGLYDEAFVHEWTHGFEELKARVRDFTPERASEITWIPKDAIVAIARKYGASKPASTLWGVGLDQTKECVPTVHAIISLWAVTGNLDVPGGQVIRSSLFGYHKTCNIWGMELLTEEQAAKQVGLGQYPFLDWCGRPPNEAVVDQILTSRPYPIRAGWFQTTNSFACGAADAKRVHEALRSLEFNVVVDLFMTPTAMACADIVLPVSTYAERDAITQIGGSGSYVGRMNRAIDPVGEAKSDMEINLELGRRLSPAAWPWANVDEMFDALLEPTGMTFAELRDAAFTYDDIDYRKYAKGLLRADGKAGFETPTGKLELYSEVFARCGLDPLPYWEEPPQSPVSTPDIAEKYPLILTTGPRTTGFFASEHRQIPSLRKLNPDPISEIHPDTAAKLGIQDGDWIYIENQHGRCCQKARLTIDIDPRVVSAQHGWWFPEKPGPEPSLFGVWESNINLLIPAGLTGKSGLGYPFRNLMCKIYKAANNSWPSTDC